MVVNGQRARDWNGVRRSDRHGCAREGVRNALVQTESRSTRELRFSVKTWSIIGFVRYISDDHALINVIHWMKEVD